MEQRARRQPPGPFRALQYRTLGKVLHVADAEVGDGNDALGNREDLSQRIVANDADPSDAESLRARSQPEVLDRQTGRIDLHVADADFAQHAGTEAVRLAGDDQVERGFENSFELEREKFLAARAAELRGIALALLIEHPPDFAPALEIAHDEEVPWLCEPDAGRVMGRDQYARQDFVGNRVAQELPHIAAAENRL